MADIVLTGNIGSVELKYTPNGRAALALSVAENHRRRVGDQWQDDGVTWWRITVWERQAETLAETLTKGDRVLVTGTIRSRDWEDRDGQKRTAHDVTARHIAVVPKAQPSGARQAEADPWAAAATTEPF